MPSVIRGHFSKKKDAGLVYGDPRAGVQNNSNHTCVIIANIATLNLSSLYYTYTS